MSKQNIKLIKLKKNKILSKETKEQLERRKKNKKLIKSLNKELSNPLLSTQELYQLLNMAQVQFHLYPSLHNHAKRIIYISLVKNYKRQRNKLGELRFLLELLLLDDTWNIKARLYEFLSHYASEKLGIPKLQSCLLSSEQQVKRINQIRQQYSEFNPVNITEMTEHSWENFIKNKKNQVDFTIFISKVVMACLGSYDNLPFIVLATENFIENHEFENKEDTIVNQELINLIVNLILTSTLLPTFIIDQYIQVTSFSNSTIKKNLTLIETQMKDFFSSLSTHILSQDSITNHKINQPASIIHTITAEFNSAWQQKKSQELLELEIARIGSYKSNIFAAIGIVLSCGLLFYSPILAFFAFLLALAAILFDKSICIFFQNLSRFSTNMAFKQNIGDTQVWELPGYTVHLKPMPPQVQEVKEEKSINIIQAAPSTKIYYVNLALNSQPLPSLSDQHKQTHDNIDNSSENMIRKEKKKTIGIPDPRKAKVNFFSKKEFQTPAANLANNQKLIQFDNGYKCVIESDKNVFEPWVHGVLQRNRMAAQWGNCGIKFFGQGKGEIKPPRSDAEHKKDRADLIEVGSMQVVGIEQSVPVYKIAGFSAK